MSSQRPEYSQLTGERNLLQGERAQAFEARKKNAAARKELEQARHALKTGPLKGVRLNGVRPSLSPNKENTVNDNEYEPAAEAVLSVDLGLSLLSAHRSLDDADSTEDTSFDNEPIHNRGLSNEPPSKSSVVDDPFSSWSQDLLDAAAGGVLAIALPVHTPDPTGSQKCLEFDQIIAGFHETYGEFQP